LAGRKTINIMTKRRQRHSPEQIVRKIQDADRILAEDAKKLKHLGKQNLQLKKLLAEAELEKAVACPQLMSVVGVVLLFDVMILLKV
jgi:hypothetical protein